MRTFIGIGILMILLVGCKKTEVANPNMGYEFYPAEVGTWISYEVDSVVHSEGEETDTFRYQIKELIESAFTDEAGRSSRRVERYFRNDDSEPWVIKDIWMVAITNRKVEKTEENIRYVRLTFPVKEGNYWDGNSLNDNDSWEYSYSAVGINYNAENEYFDDCAIVEQEGAVNLIEQKRGKEVYSRNLGLINKELIEIDTDINYTSNPIPTNIQGGYELYYRYLSHGQN